MDDIDWQEFCNLGPLGGSPLLSGTEELCILFW